MAVLLPCSLISVFRRITFLKKRGRRMINCGGWNLSRARGDGGVGGGDSRCLLYHPAPMSSPFPAFPPPSPTFFPFFLRSYFIWVPAFPSPPLPIFSFLHSYVIKYWVFVCFTLLCIFSLSSPISCSDFLSLPTFPSPFPNHLIFSSQLLSFRRR